MHVGSAFKSGHCSWLPDLPVSFFLVLKISKLQYLCCISGELNVDFEILMLSIILFPAGP